ncbi:hypothetical protein Tco_0152631 [Tanacetum coccineum]
MDLTAAAKNRFMELNELMELRDRAYENTRIYKERTKKWHDSRLRGDKDFKNGDNVLLFNSRLKLHPGQSISKWMQYGVSLGLGSVLEYSIDLAVKKSTIWYTLKKTCVELVRAF